MMDLALCKNDECPSRGHCFRAVAVPSCHQVYGQFTVPAGKDRCRYYMPTQMDLPLDTKAQL